MEGTRRQRILRAATLIVVGLGGVLLVSGDAPRALRDPRVWAWLVPMLSWTIWENAILREDEPRAYRGKWGTRIAQASVVLASLAGAWEALAFRQSPGGMPAWVAGATIIAAGAALRLWAIATLAEHFRYELRVDEHQELVRSGPYRLLRHPSYTGLVLIGAGIAVCFGSWLAALLGVGLLFVVLAARASGEERLLTRAFGSSYEEYRKRTWRLVPYIY